MDRVREAIQLCLDVEGDDAQPLDFVGIQQIARDCELTGDHLDSLLWTGDRSVLVGDQCRGRIESGPCGLVRPCAIVTAWR